MSFFRMPNKHHLDFFKYFDGSVSEVLCPFYLIPSKYSEEKEEVIIDPEIFTVFRQDSRFINNPNSTFFEKRPTDSVFSMFSISNYSIIEEMMNVPAKEEGLVDLVVGFYDQIADDFIQVAYIKDFYNQRLYGILDYAYHTTAENFFRDEDMLDLRVSRTHQIASETMGVSISESDIIYIIEELKKVCIEGSFYDSYKNDIMGMNNDIAYRIQSILMDRKITLGVNIQAEMNLISYLKSLGVLEMYISIDENRFTSLTFLKDEETKSMEKDGKMMVFFGFHPSFLSMLDDKYG